MNKQIDTGWESSVFIVILDICFVIIVRKRFGLISTCCSYLTHFIPMFPYIPMRSSILVSMEITQPVFTCSKSTTETPEQRVKSDRRSGAFIANFEHILHIILVFHC